MTDARRAAVEAACAAYDKADHARSSRSAMDAAIAAYLAHRAEAGFVEVRDVGAVEPPAAPTYYDREVGSGWRVGWDAGHNACRAAMIAARAVGEG